MSFLTEYQNRYSTQIRTNVSNPQNTAATTPDTSREAEADTDVKAEFKMRGITPDEDDDRHITVAVRGIYAFLCTYTGQMNADELMTRFYDHLDLLRETTSRDRIQAVSNSNLKASEDENNALPASDKDRLRGYVPKTHGLNNLD